MELTQIAPLLNETIVPNLLGQETTIAEDLSNIVDLGTAIADIDADAVKDYAKTFVAGVARNWFDTRRYKKSDLGLYTDAREFGGVVQRVKGGLLTAVDSPIWTLESGVDYNDGHYYGIDTDNKIYMKDTIFQVKNSIPSQMFKQSFTSADGVRELIALIESRVDNTISLEIDGLARTVYAQMIANGNKVNLVSLYNSYAGLSGANALTAETAINNHGFLRWSAQQIVRLRNLVTNFNKKYNDGTIETFTPREDLRVTLLDEFATSLMFNMESDTFHNDLVSVGEYNTITYWQNSSEDLLPSLGTTAEVKTVVGEESPVTVSNCVGCLFDKYGAGITSRLEKVSAGYVPQGDFTNYFHHIAKCQFVDLRNTAVILTLN